jgi:hypothetical protein
VQEAELVAAELEEDSLDLLAAAAVAVQAEALEAQLLDFTYL